MVTPEQSRANLRSAERLAAIRLGIDAQDGSPLLSLTYAQRVAYLAELAAVIQKTPAAFLPQTVATAAAISAKTYSPLDDASFDWDAFTTAAVDAAVDLGASVAAVGEGVKAGLNLTRYLIPAAVLVGAYLLYLAARKRANV